MSSPHAGAVRAVLRVLPLVFLPMTVHFPAVSQSGPSRAGRGGVTSKGAGFNLPYWKGCEGEGLGKGAGPDKRGRGFELITP